MVTHLWFQRKGETEVPLSKLAGCASHISSGFSWETVHEYIRWRVIAGDFQRQVLSSPCTQTCALHFYVSMPTHMPRHHTVTYMCTKATIRFHRKTPKKISRRIIHRYVDILFLCVCKCMCVCAPVFACTCVCVHTWIFMKSCWYTLNLHLGTSRLNDHDWPQALASLTCTICFHHSAKPQAAAPFPADLSLKSLLEQKEWQ